MEKSTFDINFQGQNDILLSPNYGTFTISILGIKMKDKRKIQTPYTFYSKKLKEESFILMILFKITLFGLQFSTRLCKIYAVHTNSIQDEQRTTVSV